MELICLDTTILIDHRRSKDKSQSLLFKLSFQYNLAVTSITVFELWKGDNTNEDAFWMQLFSKMTLLDFDVDSGKIAGADFLHLKQKGQIIDIEDILIGGVAKRNNLRVATTNTNHFSRVEGLQLIDLQII
ncbi:MAG: type II toxin-antitoxin system VapC family toxin [Saprospiraceae bacterium]|jgi:tRNA(fMet)-specific endonuclease VapC|nr:type II toxin-antitoxin system VapC family toxin [Saprospiraceae bacterium]